MLREHLELEKVGMNVLGALGTTLSDPKGKGPSEMATDRIG